MVLKISVMTIAILLLVGCSDSDQASIKEKTTWGGPAMPANLPVPQRWYTDEQVERGNLVFQANCAVCHKPDASGTPNWKETDANGKYPPPPLNGSAHAWHHSLNVLRRVIHRGGAPLGGTMPAFKDKLTQQQIDDAIAWIQSNWSDEIYQVWHQRNQQD